MKSNVIFMVHRFKRRNKSTPKSHFTNLLCFGGVIFGVGDEKWKIVIGVIIDPLTEEISNVKSSVGERHEISTPLTTFVSAIIMHNT